MEIKFQGCDRREWIAFGKADPDEPTLIFGYWHVGPHRSLYVVATEVLGAMGYQTGPTGELYKF